ncbi:MAG: carboxypeptidase-like regulatory domain-containing protein [candidate division WOR-3 bacterium]
MRKILTIPLVIFISLFSHCINAPRSNKYDPKNPDKAEVQGYVYEPDSLTITGAIINLLNYNNNIVQAETSDADGCFSFTRIDPGIYKITAQTKYFANIIIENESLWAGKKLTNYRIFFNTFHFEDDEINSVPYGFITVSGDWRISEDSNGNHIYTGTDTDNTNPAITFFRNRTHAFKFSFKFMVSPVSGQNWETGILLWYQDSLNFYSIKITKTSVQYRLMKNGSLTVFYTKIRETTEGVFHTLKAVQAGDALPIYLDDIYLFPVSLINTAFENGYWGLYIMNHEPAALTTVNFDDICLEIP